MNSRTKALMAVMLGNSIFGFSFIFSKLALQVAVPSVLIAVRFFVAFLVLNIVVIMGRNIKVDGKDGEKRPLIEFSLKDKPLKYILLLAVFQPVIYFICESYGILYTSSAFAGTIIAVIPIAGVIFDFLLMHSKVTVRQVLCAVFSAVGVVITTAGAEGMKSSVLGVLFLLGAVTGGSLFYVFSKKSGDSYSPIERTYVMFLLGFVVFGIMALVQCHGNYSELILKPLMTPQFAVSILYLSVFSSVAAFILLNYGAEGVSVSEASIFANFTTVISIIAGVVFLGERFTSFQLLGALIIIVSVYISSVKRDETE